jgi:UDP-glucuronate decarboxylase
MTRVLVTGGAGFIGSHLVRTLVDRAHDVAVVVRPTTSLYRLEDIADRIRLVRGDVAHPSEILAVLGGWRPEACAHLAWYAEPATYLVARENLEALSDGVRFLTHLIDAGCSRFLITGTCAEYGVGDGPLHEDSKVDPQTLYAAAKLSMLMLAQQLTRQSGAVLTWARLFYLYGPFEAEQRLVPLVIRALLADREFAASTGAQVRDYLHVTDMAGALCALVEAEVGGTVNVCSGVPTSVRELLEEIGRLLGRSELIRFGAVSKQAAWDPAYVCGNNARLLNETSWRPRYELTTGLEETIRWWRSRN